MPKREQLAIAETMLWMAKVCMVRLASVACEAIGQDGRMKLVELELDMMILQGAIEKEKESCDG